LARQHNNLQQECEYLWDGGSKPMPGPQKTDTFPQFAWNQGHDFNVKHVIELPAPALRNPLPAHNIPMLPLFYSWTLANNEPFVDPQSSVPELVPSQS
jgi:hypothetical protein